MRSTLDIVHESGIKFDNLLGTKNCVHDLKSKKFSVATSCSFFNIDIASKSFSISYTSTRVAHILINIKTLYGRMRFSLNIRSSSLGYTTVDDHLVKRASRANMVIHERVTSFELAPCSPCCIAAGCSPKQTIESKTKINSNSKI